MTTVPSGGPSTRSDIDEPGSGETDAAGVASEQPAARVEEQRPEDVKEQPAGAARATTPVADRDVESPGRRAPDRVVLDADGGSRRKRRRVPMRLLVVGVVIVGALSFLLFKGLSGSLDYFETVDQALSHRAMLGTQDFRLEGLVEPGTVRRSANGVSFVARGTHHSIPVVNTGEPPQLFQPDIPVVVVGHFSGAMFVSNQIIVDHSAQYIQAHPARVTAPNGTRR